MTVIHKLSTGLVGTSQRRLKIQQLLKKEAKVLADNLADSIFTTLADSLADAWRIKTESAKKLMLTRGYGAFALADKLADSWRGIIRQSATPFRVADVWRMLGLADPVLSITSASEVSQ